MTDAIETRTIAAIATAEGEGGIGVVRISGPLAQQAFERCFVRTAKSAVQSHRFYYGHVVDANGEHIDEAMGVVMRAPRSYTREDVCELHCHGGRLTARRVLNRVLALGIHAAGPGEFTKRAFLNGRIALCEAEGVMALISASSEGAARAAMHQLSGGVSHFVIGLKDRLLELLALIEAGNDFPEEIEEQATREQVLQGAHDIRQALLSACDERAARIVREGLRVVISGKPNVGKSSLLNALLGQQRAIVTDIPGTTRDVLTERLRLGSLLIEISDTAGQRETQDEVERMGVERALLAQQDADVVLLVLDASQDLDEQDRELLSRADGRTMVVFNKTDLIADAQPSHEKVDGLSNYWVCARTGQGIDALLEGLSGRLQVQDLSERQMVEGRHIECAKQAAAALQRAVVSLEACSPVDLAAIDLMEALRELSEITGESATEGLIERIFARFCVGK